MSIFLLIIIHLAGYLLMSSIDNKLSFLMKLSVGYLVSISLTTLFLFILNIVGIQYSQINTLLVISFLSLLSLLIISLKGVRLVRPNYNRIKMNLLEKRTFFIIAALALVTIIASAYWPITDWDSIVLYDYRAKSFANTGNMSEAISTGYFFGYPLLTSLAQMMIYQFGGLGPGIIHSFFYIHFLIIIYSYFSKKIKRKWILISTLFIAIIPDLFIHAQMTYTNLPFTIYFVTAYIFLEKWLENKSISNLLIFSILVGSSIWTRSTEPYWVAYLILIFIYSIIKKKYLHFAIFYLVVSIFRKPWLIFREISSGNPIGNVATQALSSVSIAFSERIIRKLPLISEYFYRYILEPRIFITISFIFSIIYVFNSSKEKSKFLPLLLLILLSYSITLAGIFVFSSSVDYWKEIGGSATRMTMFLPILEIIFIIKVIFYKKNSNLNE